MKTLKKIPFKIIVAFFFVTQIYPMCWLLLASFKQGSDLATNPFGLNIKLTLENYETVFHGSNVFLYLKNSVIIALFVLVLVTILSSMCGFALSVMRFKGRKKLFSYIVGGLTIPAFVALIPLYLIYAKIGLIDTRVSVIITFVAYNLPINVLLFVNFYKYVPEDLLQAALLDGCNIYQVYFNIYLKLSLNTIVTVLAMTFIGVWNDYLFSLLFINSTSLKTVTLGIQDFIGDFGYRNWGAIFASITITTLPTVIVYFLLNNKVTAGMTLGATKG